MTNHTPGPWTASENGDVVTPDGLIMPPGDDAATIRTNAALIAAAPEMLKALLALAKSHWPGADHSAQEFGEEHLSPSVRLARAAIRKATGA